ncbi:MAG TPA: glycosyltransferase family 2 protein [Burkholderiaceae bacterium]
MNISVITVTYNSANEIADFVHSLDTQQVDWRLWLIDNASRDKTADVLAGLSAKDSRVTVMINRENIGLAAANNQPLAALQTDYVAIVNPDVVLHPAALKTLTEYLDTHLDVVAVAPVNVDADGTPHSSFHHSWGLRHLLVWRVFPAKVARRLYKWTRHYGEQDVLFASGACLVTRTADFVAIGGYDPAYFLTIEDVCDLCIRLRGGDMRKRVVVYPKARITHLISRSAVSAPFATLWYAACGSIYHFRKHHGRMAGWTAFSIVLASTLIRSGVAAVKALFDRRYVTNLKNNLRVLTRLFVDNPIRQFRKGAQQ